MAKFRVTVSTNKVGSKCEDTYEIDDEDIKGMSDNDVEEELREAMFQMIEWNYERID